MTYHILPIKDIEKHEEKSTCKCSPKCDILENGDLMIIHNSFDGREYIEQVKEILKIN